MPLGIWNCFCPFPSLARTAHIAGLFRKGIKKTEIREDHPALSDLDLAFASIHARMSPPPSRPRKPPELSRGKAA
jgi:hypothetical protein